MPRSQARAVDAIILDDPELKKPLKILLRRVWADYVPRDFFERIPPKNFGMFGDAQLAAPLVKVIKEYRKASAESPDVYPMGFCDADHVYLAASRGPHTRYGQHWGTAVDLLRIAATDDGDFGAVEVASIAPDAAKEIPLDDLLLAAVDEGAWD